MSFRAQIVKLADQVGGNVKTRHDRKIVAERLAYYLQKKNIQINDVKYLKTKHIESYINCRINIDEISKRTAQNELSNIRKIMSEAGMDKLAYSERLSCKSLGVSGASRAGTKTAIPNELFRLKLDEIENYDHGVASCIMLERILGLRGEEAVQSYKSLETWAETLERTDTIRVIFGTKGGRPRDTHVVHVERAREVIAIALQRVKDNNGRLIDRPDLKTAMNRYSNVLRSFGFTGQYSPHSMRYAFARDRYNKYLDQGFSAKESLAMTSMDLGHGDGRGAYVKKVYLK